MGFLAVLVAAVTAAFDGVVRILVVGGGIAGLTFGAAMRARSVEVTIVEHQPAWRPVGGGIAMQPNAMRALGQLGLAGPVRERGSAVHRWTFLDRDGGLLFDVDLDELWSDVGPFVGIDRGRLREVLARGAPPCRVGVTVATLDERRGAVHVELTDGSSGIFDVVVGADGIHSAVRDLIVGGTRARLRRADGVAGGRGSAVRAGDVLAG